MQSNSINSASSDNLDILVVETESGKKVIFQGKEYSLYEFTEEDISVYHSKNKASLMKYVCNSGLLSIDEKNNVWTHNIPEKYLKYALLNEVLCPDVLSGEGLCLEALKTEIGIVKQDYYEDYIVWRRNFFNGMVIFYSEIEGSTDNTRKYLKEMISCRDYLEGLINDSKNLSLKTVAISEEISRLVYETLGLELKDGKFYKDGEKILLQHSLNEINLPNTDFPQELEKYGGIKFDTNSKGLWYGGDIPSKYLKYALLHEIHCPVANSDAGLCNHGGKCRDASVYELTLVKEELGEGELKNYIGWKINQIRNLIDYMAATDDPNNHKKVPELRLSLSFLEEKL